MEITLRNGGGKGDSVLIVLRTHIGDFHLLPEQDYLFPIGVSLASSCPSFDGFMHGPVDFSVCAVTM